MRNSTIVGLGIAIGMGITSVPDATANLDPMLKMVFTSSPVILSTLVVFLLNIVLPNKTLEQERIEREKLDE